MISGVPTAEECDLKINLEELYRKYSSYGDVNSIIRYAAHYERDSKTAKEELKLLTHMLKHSGYGPEKIDAYADRCREVERLKKLTVELIDQLRSINSHAANALCLVEEQADCIEDG